MAAKKIKLTRLDDEYAILEIGPHIVYVKAEEGGIVCDVFAHDTADAPTVSCWAEYAEMEDDDENDNDDGRYTTEGGSRDERLRTTD